MYIYTLDQLGLKLIDNHTPRLSARDIGKQIGATDVEVNFLLKDQGFLDGGPGAYGLTPKGMEFGIQQSHDNGYGGHAYRQWETTHFDPSVIEALDSSPERLAKAHEDVLAHKHALGAERKLAQAQAEAGFQAFQASKEADIAEQELDPQKLVLVIAGIVLIAGVSYGVYRGVQWRKRKRAAKTDPDVAA